MRQHIQMRGIGSFSSLSSNETDSLQNQKISPTLILPLLEMLITEKRIEFRNRMDVSIDLVLSEYSYGVFGNVDPVEFKRVLSNLINNGIE